jgi:MFS transporter, DHA1 family, inner membrane transport protein
VIVSTAAFRRPGSPGHPRLTLLVLSLCTFIFITTETMPIALLTWMGPSLNVSATSVGWLVTGYGLVVAAVSVPLARFTLRFPRRPLLCCTFAVFTCSVLVTAAAPTYGYVLVARVVTALSHAVFWSIIPTTAASLFPPAGRDRAVATLFMGSALGAVLGVPMVAWIGLHEGWRACFVLGGLVALVLLAGLLFLLPHSQRKDEAHAVGRRPNRWQYRTLLVAGAMLFTGVFTFQTYITLFLTKTSGFASASLGPILLLGGVGGFVGVTITRGFAPRRPWAAIALPMLLSVLVLSTAFILATNKAVIVVLIFARGLSFSAMSSAIQVRVLNVAPASTDVATAGCSSVFNLGTAVGALLGGLVVSDAGVRAVAGAGGLVSLFAVVVLLVGVQMRSRPQGAAPLLGTAGAAGPE